MIQDVPENAEIDWLHDLKIHQSFTLGFHSVYTAKNVINHGRFHTAKPNPFPILYSHLRKPLDSPKEDDSIELVILELHRIQSAYFQNRRFDTK